MASSLSLLTKPHRSLISLLNRTVRPLSTSPELALDTLPPPRYPHSPLPLTPASGSPHYTSSTWRTPSSSSLSLSLSTVPPQLQALAHTLDQASLSNLFSTWTPEQRWAEIKLLFDTWITSLDSLSGQPNKPSVDLFNTYLRACFMVGGSVGDLLDILAKMESDYGILPNTASFNLVLKAMSRAKEIQAALKLLQRMLQTKKDSPPNDESFDLVVGMLLINGQFDSALKYIDLMLKSGHTISVQVFTECVRSCVTQRRLDTLVSIIERCKKMDQNKDLCPPWLLCNSIAEVAMQADNAELAYCALEYMAKWMAKGEKSRPKVFLSAEEGLVVATLGTAGRTYNTKLLDGSWSILKRSLRQKKVPNPETYIAKLYAQALLGNLQSAFGTLHEFETAYSNSREEVKEDLFSPFTSLYPLVLACSKNGFTTLDSVYYQLENLSKQADHPYRSVAALNCIVLGCANIWDDVRAFQTFEAISDSFKLTPNIHSYNALISVFGKLKKRDEALKVFTHLISVGVKPNVMTYSLLVDVHLGERDVKAALSVIDEMVSQGFESSREMLKKIRRRCIREMDYKSNDLVELVAKKFKIRLGQETRRDLLFNLNYGANYE